MASCTRLLRRTLSAAGGALGEELLDRAGLAGAEFFIAFRDRRADLRVPDLARVLKLVGGEFWNDRDRATAGLHFELLSAFKTRTPQGGWRHHDGSFVFEGDGHGS